MELDEKLKWIFKIICYILFVKFAFIIVLAIFSLPVIGVLFVLSLSDKLYNIINGLGDDFGFYLITLYIPAIFSPFACYFTAKIFGIFRYIDALNKRMIIKIGILFLISLASFAIMFLRIKLEGDTNPAAFYAFYIFGLVPAFFLYKYFNYLTMKYPVPFEKIGYYSSVEFYKDLWRKIRKK